MSRSDIYTVEGEGPKMRKAYSMARKTFKYFWRELSWEYRRIVPALDMAIVKIPFATGARRRGARRRGAKRQGVPPVEHMWIGNIHFDGSDVSGVLLNNPRWARRLKEGDEVSVPLAEIEDWLYAIEGKAYGGFTVHCMRMDMGRAEMNEHDAAWGLDFGKPGDVKVAINEEKVRVPVPDKAGQVRVVTRFPEHPMSVNMEEKVRASLAANPDVVNGVDEDGWTMMHREALAGNEVPIRVLLECGADKAIRNRNGDTALAIAQRMGWGAIVKLLS